eukprot:GHVS01012272.1.p1 GENE.GHVS01012272.1~~GHVS01012272.1.p1  ORF type:complete len:449 (-),score=82.97 GHVS01012272.1:1502-2848(-)
MTVTMNVCGRCLTALLLVAGTRLHISLYAPTILCSAFATLATPSGNTTFLRIYSPIRRSTNLMSVNTGVMTSLYTEPCRLPQEHPEQQLLGAWQLFLPPAVYSLSVVNDELTQKGRLVGGQPTRKKRKTGLQEGWEEEERDEGFVWREGSRFVRVKDKGRRERLFLYPEKKVLSPSVGCAGGWHLKQIFTQESGSINVSTVEMSLERNFNHSNYMTLKGLLVLSPHPVLQQLDGEVSFYGAAMMGYVYECSQRVDVKDPSAEFGTALPPNIQILRPDGQKATTEELKRIFRAASRGGKPEEEAGTLRSPLIATAEQPFVSRRLGCFTAYRVLGEEYSPSGIPNCFTGLSPTKIYSMYDPYMTIEKEQSVDLIKSVLKTTADHCMDYTYSRIKSTLPAMLSQIEREGGPTEALMKLMQDRTDVELAYNSKYADAEFDEELPPMPQVGPS